MLLAIAIVVGALVAFVLVQDVAYFVRGHESLLERLVARLRPLRVRVVRIPCERIQIRTDLGD